MCQLVLSLLVHQEQRHLLAVAELADDLAAATAGRREGVPIDGYSEAREFSSTRRDGRSEDSDLSTPAAREGGILDVDAGEDASILIGKGSADGEIAVAAVGVLQAR